MKRDNIFVEHFNRKRIVDKINRLRNTLPKFYYHRDLLRLKNLQKSQKPIGHCLKKT